MKIMNKMTVVQVFLYAQSFCVFVECNSSALQSWIALSERRRKDKDTTKLIKSLLNSL